MNPIQCVPVGPLQPSFVYPAHPSPESSAQICLVKPVGPCPETNNQLSLLNTAHRTRTDLVQSSPVLSAQYTSVDPENYIQSNALQSSLMNLKQCHLAHCLLASRIQNSPVPDLQLSPAQRSPCQPSSEIQPSLTWHLQRHFVSRVQSCLVQCSPVLLQ